MVNFLLFENYLNGNRPCMEQLRAWRMNLPEGQNTLDAAAPLLGVSAVQLSRYETGTRRIPLERVPLISKVTGVAREILRPDFFVPEPAE